MYKRSRHEAQINGLRQSLSGITEVKFVAERIVEFEHSSTTTPDQIENELKELGLKPTLLTVVLNSVGTGRRFKLCGDGRRFKLCSSCPSKKKKPGALRGWGEDLSYVKISRRLELCLGWGRLGMGKTGGLWGWGADLSSARDWDKIGASQFFSLKRLVRRLELCEDFEKIGVLEDLSFTRDWDKIGGSQLFSLRRLVRGLELCEDFEKIGALFGMGKTGGLWDEDLSSARDWDKSGAPQIFSFRRLVRRLELCRDGEDWGWGWGRRFELCKGLG
ncbi:hypothetical protein SUGI_0732890 [Cryptomeria japonica]|nr:hypothetical protein SUGI_0732890 [Cryptomeria japonica]